jgi:hypothetical protein
MISGDRFRDRSGLALSPKFYLVNESGFLQVAQRVVNRCVADPGQAPARSFKDFAGRRVIVTLPDHLKHSFSLGSQLWLLLVSFTVDLD